METMTFGEAISEVIDNGRKVSRRGWNGTTSIYIYSVDINDLIPYSFIALHTSAATEQPGWVPSQMDMFADDWFIFGGDGTSDAPETPKKA